MKSKLKSDPQNCGGSFAITPIHNQLWRLTKNGRKEI